jgi:CheY-like chemotaxis protein
LSIPSEWTKSSSDTVFLSANSSNFPSHSKAGFFDIFCRAITQAVLSVYSITTVRELAYGAGETSRKRWNRRAMRILYVEEHPDSCELLALWLGGIGYEVVPANTVYDGLRLARSGNFTAYILSNQFIDGTGIELCRQIRMFDPNTPIIFYSAMARDTDLSQAREAGAQAYLILPDDFERIDLTIKRLLK